MISLRFWVLGLSIIVVCCFFSVNAYFDCFKDEVSYINDCKLDTPFYSSCDFNTEYTVNCAVTCQNEISNVIWGTKYYTYDSSLCRSALHDLRISSWNTKQRTVTFVRKYEDYNQFHNTIRQGIESVRYGRIFFNNGLFYFTSPKIKEPLVDMTSLHRNFIFENNQYSEQECHLPRHSDNRLVYFSYHNILEKGTPIPTMERIYGKNHDYYKVIWGQGHSDKMYEDEIGKSIPGGVTCRLDRNDLSVITSMTMRSDAHFRPSKLTVTGNVGEPLILGMIEMNSCEPYFKVVTWRKDAQEMGSFQDFKIENDVLTHYLRYDSLVEGHAGVYSLECNHYSGERFDKRGVVRLIVRSCPANFFGDHCNIICPDCLNGGICHDILGVCICPPGFKGSNCETPCGRNSFGADCSKTCLDTDASGSKTCSGLLFCLPDPYGCSCATGFYGIDCKSPCPPGKYGAGCTQECRCAERQPCDAYTGLCSQGCEAGWKESTCDTSYPFLSTKPKLVTAKPTRLDLSFQAWDGTSGKGTPASYVVEIKESASEERFHEVHRFNASTLTYPDFKKVSIQSLTPNTEYTVRVIIVDVDGQAQRKLAPSGIFRACRWARDPPYDLNVTSLDSRTVLLTWKHPGPEIKCSKVTFVISYNNSQWHFEAKTKEKSLRFPSKPFTTWTIAIKTETENNKSSDWAVFPIVTTFQEAPEEPSSLNASFDKTSASIHVNWTKPLESNGILRAYSVELVHVEWQHSCINTVPRIVFNVSSEVTSTVFNATNFKFSSTYNVSVAAITIEKGPASIKAITIPKSIPEAAPRNLSVDDIGRTECVLRWHFPDCVFANGDISKFNLSFQGLEEWASNILIRLVPINGAHYYGLIPYTNYEVSVVACTSAGCGQQSANVTFTTLPSTPGPPKDLMVFGLSTSSMSIMWLPPFPPLSNVTSYIILYEERNTGNSIPTSHKVNELLCLNSELRLNQLCYTIKDLEARTDYDIWVIAIDNDGKESQRNKSYVSGRTEEFKPEAPKELELVNRTTNSLLVSWQEPVKSNGVLIEYRIIVTLINLYGLDPIDGQVVYYIHITVEGEDRLFNITDLEPASTYTVAVEARTRVGYGLPVSEIFYTRILVPKINTRPEVGKITNDSVQLIMKPVTSYKGPISAYFVLVKDVTNKHYNREAMELQTYNQSQIEYIAAKLEAKKLSLEGIIFTVGDGEYYDEFYNAPLQNEHEYIFGIAVLCEVDGERQIGFEYMDQVIHVTETLTRKPLTAIIVGPISALFLVIGIFLLIFLCKKSNAKKETNGNLEPEVTTGSINSSTDTHHYEECQLRNRTCVKNNSIRIKDLEVYVQEANKSFKISQEHSTGKGLLYPCEVGGQAQNISKNRYPLLLPYDHSRVILERIEGDKYSDYINANYIKNYKGDPKFIATQGPVLLTVNDFWRMVWQENVCKIIMLTNLVEVGKSQCEKYWPESADQYGQFTVKLVETVTFANHVIRTMLVSKDECGFQREIKQFHFTTWPDHGIPAYPFLVTAFLKQIRNYKKDSESPVVVHCSAGNHRTGSIILLANMIEMAKDTNTVDVKQGLLYIRQNRVNMVETLEQYVFVYHALLEHIYSDETSLICPLSRNTYDGIVNAKNASQSVAQNQFERLNRLCPPPKFIDCRVARDPKNERKNRVADILPTDRARAVWDDVYVHQGDIFPVNEAGQNDYINAVYINGYKQNNAFITTQLPLPDTINDFWRLVHSAKIRCILLLHEFNPNHNTCPQYWADGATETYGAVEVTHVSSETRGTVVVRTFQIRDVNLNDKEETVKQFHLQGWFSTEDTPETPDCILELIEMTERWQRKTGTRTILVQCLDGSSGCGILCASVFTLDKIQTENEVDVYLAVRCVRTNRPQFIKNLNQYLFLHKVAITYAHGHFQ